MSRKLLNAATATGAGTAVTSRADKHSVQVTYTGSPTTVTVALEGSINGTSFFTIGSDTIAASGDMFFAVDKPVKYVRANLTVLSGGTSPTVTVLYDSED